VFAVFPHLFYGLAVFKKSKSIKKAALWGVTAFLFFGIASSRLIFVG
jgi:hypothetical protein